MKHTYLKLSSALLFCGVCASGPSHAVTIIPTFEGTTYTEEIKAEVYAAIDFYTRNMDDNVTVFIRLKDTGTLGTGLGSTFQGFNSVSYREFIEHLRLDASGMNDQTALQHISFGTGALPAEDQVTPVPDTSSRVWLTRPQAAALGISVGDAPDGKTIWDADIDMNLSVMSFNHVSPAPNKYDFRGILMHEINEVLGSTSNMVKLGVNDRGIRPFDLFRYDDQGNRSFTTEGDNAYFSIDGTNFLTRLNQESGGDYGDFWSPGSPSEDNRPFQLQDAFSTVGLTAEMNVENVMMDVLGWNYAKPGSAIVVQTGAPVVGAGLGIIPEGALWKGVTNPAMNNSGRFAFVGTLRIGRANVNALVLDDRVIAKVGDDVPGIAGLKFRGFRSPQIDEEGNVAFLALLSGSGVNSANGTALCYTRDGLHVVARLVDVAPGTGGAKLKAISNFSAVGGDGSNARGLVYTGQLVLNSGSPAVSASTDRGLWAVRDAEVSLIAREGAPIQGMANDAKLSTFNFLSLVAGATGQGFGHSQGDEVTFPATTNKKDNVLVRSSGGIISLIAKSTDSLGSTKVPEAKWNKFGVVGTDSSGTNLMVKGSLRTGASGVPVATSNGIFASTDAGVKWEPIARVGDVQDGLTISSLGAAVQGTLSNESNSVSFIGKQKGSGITRRNADAIWISYGGSSYVAAQAGSQAAGVTGATWTRFTSIAAPGGDLFTLFTADMAGAVPRGSRGLWAITTGNQTELLFRTGQVVSGKTVRSFTVLTAELSNLGTKRSFGNRNTAMVRALFTDGTSAIIRVRVPVTSTP